MVDCDQRHAALTDPHEWETLRLQARLVDLRDGLAALDDRGPSAPQ
jgi:hypothetical protein